MLGTKHTIALAASVLLALAPGAAFAATPPAAQALTVAQAQRLVEKLFAIPRTYTLTQENYDSAQNGQPAQYNLTWSGPQVAGQQLSINATVATNGLILNYNRTPSQAGFVYPLPVSAAKAQGLAEAWAHKLYPQFVSSTRLQPVALGDQPLTQAVQYGFNFVRVVHGIPAPFDGFSITIDQQGHLVSAFENWTDSPFPNPASRISAAAAQREYEADLHLHLAFEVSYQGNANGSDVLVYEQAQGNYPQFYNDGFTQQQVGLPVIDAFSGDTINATGAVQALPRNAPDKPLVTGGPQVLPTSRRVNWDETKALAYAVSVLHLSPQYVLTGKSESQNLSPTARYGSNDVMWTFTWTKKGAKVDGEPVTKSAQVDATAGFLSSYYGSFAKVVPGAQVQHKAGRYLSAAALNRIARAFVKRLFPEDTGALSLHNVTSSLKRPDEEAVFSLHALVHGIPNDANTGTLDIDSQTGRITNFYSPFDQANELPTVPDHLLTKAQAKEDWMRLQPLTLEYFLTQPDDTGQSSGKAAAPRAVLVYAPMGQLGFYMGEYLNAATGQIVGGAVNQGYSGVIRGLAGVAAAPEIRLLVRYGLLPVGASGTINPKRMLTRAQFVTLVANGLQLDQNPLPNSSMNSAIHAAVSDVSSSSPDYAAIVAAYERGYLLPHGPFDPNRAASRSFAANLLARVLGFGAVMNHPQVFRLPAKDARTIPSSQFAGDAIAWGLGLFPLRHGDFDGTDSVTVASAAVALVKSVTAYTQAQSTFLDGSYGAMGAY